MILYIIINVILGNLMTDVETVLNTRVERIIFIQNLKFKI